MSMSMVNHEGLPACQYLPNLLKEKCQDIFYFMFFHDKLTQQYMNIFPEIYINQCDVGGKFLQLVSTDNGGKFATSVDNNRGQQ